MFMIDNIIPVSIALLFTSYSNKSLDIFREKYLVYFESVDMIYIWVYNCGHFATLDKPFIISTFMVRDHSYIMSSFLDQRSG